VKLEDFINRADEIITLGERTHATQGTTEWGGTHVNSELFGEFRASALSLLQNLFGASHPLYLDFHERVDNAVGPCVDTGLGIVRAARAEVAGGWIATTTGIVSAEVFADFLEMAMHLLEQHYKDPAAVLAGGVLEEHLRQLCRKHAIPVEVTTTKGTTAKKADTMNAELGTGTPYGRLDKKSVTSWLDLRNNAAHGKYTEYSDEQVDLMLRGITDFVVRNPL